MVLILFFKMKLDTIFMDKRKEELNMAKYKKINFDEVDDTNILEIRNDVSLNENISEEHEEDVNDLSEHHKGQNQILTEKERKSIAERTSAMSEDELIVVLKCIKSDLLWNELKRRYVKMNGKIVDTESILGVYISEVNPINDVAWDGMIKRYSDVEDKFTRITKGFNRSEN